MCRITLLVFAYLLSIAPLFSSGASAQSPLETQIVPQAGHSGWPYSITFSTDGRLALSGSNDNSMKLWDVASGRELRSFNGHTMTVNAAVLSADGRFALSGSYDKTLKLWDISTGAELRSFSGHTEPVEAAAISTDGRFALSGSADKTLKLWDIATGAELRSFVGHGDQVRSVAFSRDGRLAVSGSYDKTLKLWDVGTGAELRTFSGHTSGVTSVAFSPDGRTALSGSYDKTLKLWDVATGAELRSFSGSKFAIHSVAFSPDGLFAVSGGVRPIGRRKNRKRVRNSSTLKLWDVASGKELHKFGGYTSGVRAVAFSPDGRFVLSGGTDTQPKLWEAATGTAVRSFSGYVDWVNAVALSPNGRFALAASRHLKLWDMTTGVKALTIGDDKFGFNGVGFSPDGRFILSCGMQGVKLWDAATGTELRSFTGHVGWVKALAFSPDGSKAVVAGQDMKLWDVATGAELRSFAVQKEGVDGVAFLPDGRFMLSADRDKTLRLWDVTTGAIVRSFSGHTNWILSVAVSPDGRFALSGDYDHVLKLWDLATGAELRSMKAHTGPVATVAFSPDGRSAISGSYDRTMKLWDVSSGRELLTLKGHANAVVTSVFSPDGRLILSGGFDSTTRLWSTKTGQEVARMLGRPDGEWMTITPRGFFASSPGGTELLGVVRGLNSYSVTQFYDHLYRPDLVAELLKGDPEGKYKSAAHSLSLDKILDSGPAPQIERLLNRERNEDGKAQLAIRLTDRGGGIGEKVIWRVNGQTQGKTTMPGLAGAPSPGRYAVMPQTLTFDPTKKNEVEVTAYNGQGLLATPPLRFTIDPIFGLTERKPRLFVLAIGINDYLKPDWRLRYAVSDATAISSAFKTVASSIYGDNIQVETILNENATERRIDSVFDRLAGSMKAGDVFILFLSGHGRSIAGTGWFFLPQDLNLGPQTVEKNGIGQDKWRDWFAKLPPGPSVVILDACEAGASEAFRGGDRERETVIGQLVHATGRSTISAASAGKAAYEGYQGHGVLSYAILEALNKQEGAEDETVDVYGLAAHVDRRVPQISQAEFGIRQKPEPVLRDDFPLGTRKAVLQLAAAPLCKLPAQGSEANYTTSRAVQVRTKPSDNAPVALELAENSLVTIKACEGAWALISRRGKEIGYVPVSATEQLN